MPRKKVEKPEEKVEPKKTVKTPIKKVETKTTKKAPTKTPVKSPSKAPAKPSKATEDKVVEKPKKEVKPKTKTTPTPSKLPEKKNPNDTIDLNERADSEGGHVPIIERAGFSKTKRFKEDKYVRLAEDAKQEKFNEMGRKITEGLVEWSFYGVDGDKGYHYYLVLETQKKKK